MIILIIVITIIIIKNYKKEQISFKWLLSIRPALSHSGLNIPEKNVKIKVINNLQILNIQTVIKSRKQLFSAFIYSLLTHRSIDTWSACSGVLKRLNIY